MRIVVGPNNTDMMNFILMLQAFNDIKPDQVAIVWTHADKETEFTKAQGVGIINEMIEDSGIATDF